MLRFFSTHRLSIMPITAATAFDSPAFCAWWDAAHVYQLAHPMGVWALGTPDDGWALDSLLESYLEGLSPSAAVDVAIDGFDPTP
jgi:hypothetical protein